MQINDYVLQLVRLQDYAKTSQLIFTEVVGGVQNGPRKNSLHFVADQFNISKTVFFFILDLAEIFALQAHFW